MTDTAKPAVERMHPPRALWKYVVNPVMRTILKAPTHTLVDDHIGLLTYRVRKSGETYEVPWWRTPTRSRASTPG